MRVTPSAETQMQDSTRDIYFYLDSANLRHGKWSSSCCFPLLGMTSYSAWYYPSAAAGISSPRHTEPCWTGGQLKSCFSEQTGIRESPYSRKKTNYEFQEEDQLWVLNKIKQNKTNIYSCNSCIMWFDTVKEAQNNDIVLLRYVFHTETSLFTS